MCYPIDGMLLVNQVMLNKTNYVKRIEEWIALNQKEFVFQYGVHQLMVMATWGNYLPLEDKWNGMVSSRATDMSLVHFNTPADCRFMLSTMVRIIQATNSSKKDIARTACQNSLDELTEQWCRAAVHVFQQPMFKQLFNNSAFTNFLQNTVS